MNEMVTLKWMEWTEIRMESPAPHARYEVWRKETGIFVATPCYGMHQPWWVPRTVDLYSPGSTTFSMQDDDLWRPWVEISPLVGVEQTILIQGVMFILIEGGRVLMEKCPKKAKYFPGKWFIPGGWIEKDDLSPLHSMEREMFEELGCRSKHTHELPIVDATDKRGNTILMRPFVVVEWEGTIPDYCLDKPETELAWVSLRQARQSLVMVIRAVLAMAVAPE